MTVRLFPAPLLYVDWRENAETLVFLNIATQQLNIILSEFFIFCKGSNTNSIFHKFLDCTAVP